LPGFLVSIKKTYKTVKKQQNNKTWCLLNNSINIPSNYLIVTNILFIKKTLLQKHIKILYVRMLKKNN